MVIRKIAHVFLGALIGWILIVVHWFVWAAFTKMWLNSLLRLTIKCQLETSMAETRKSAPKEKTAKAKEEMLKDLDKRLDSELADTFPASDPPSLTQPTVEVGGPDRKRRKAKLRPRG